MLGVGISNKQRLEELIKEQQEICSQYRFICAYLAFDVEATRRERDAAWAEVGVLKEKLDKLGGK